MILRARQFEFRFPRPALVMGVVNVTPDSFSDGGAHLDAAAAIEHALQLVDEGADILDIGGESTRPQATPVDEQEELKRVLPIVRELASVSKVAIPLSIDTMKPRVAQEAVNAGASMINDVAANRKDAEMWRIVAASGAGYVVMHMRGTPQTMQDDPVYADVTAEIGDFFAERLERLQACDVRFEQVILDPGLGFGKKLNHNLELLRRIGHFRRYQRPLLIGASRKGFIGQVTDVTAAADRLPGSLACACAAVDAGAHIIRTHDVAATRQAMRMMEAIRAVGNAA
jgi:dihydropteroate synthase